MKKTIILTLFFLVANTLFAQKMITRNGEIKFDATYPGALDAVIGTSNSTSSIFDKSNNEFVVQVLIKSFKFKIPLMEEHFNENYMESDKFPKANFKGEIIAFDGKSGVYQIEGDLAIHGVTNKIKSKVTISISNDKLVILGSFEVKINDYNLEVPALAKKTLSDEAKVSFKLELEKK